MIIIRMILLDHLVRINETTILCPGDEVVYICTVNDLLDIEWILEVPDMQTIRVIIDTELDLVGTVHHFTLASSPVRAEFTSMNGTTLTSTLHITVALQLNGTKITCRTDIVTLNINCKVAIASNGRA